MSRPAPIDTRVCIFDNLAKLEEQAVKDGLHGWQLVAVIKDNGVGWRCIMQRKRRMPRKHSNQHLAKREDDGADLPE